MLAVPPPTGPGTTMPNHPPGWSVTLCFRDGRALSRRDVLPALHATHNILLRMPFHLAGYRASATGAAASDSSSSPWRKAAQPRYPIAVAVPTKIANWLALSPPEDLTAWGPAAKIGGSLKSRESVVRQPISHPSQETL